MLIIKHSNESSKETEIAIGKDIVDGHIALIEYLTTIDSNGNNKVDLIEDAYEKNNLGIIKEDAQQYFDSKLEYFPSWYFTISDEKELLRASREKYRVNSFQVVSLYIPTKKFNNLLITLHYSRDLAPIYTKT